MHGKKFYCTSVFRNEGATWELVLYRTLGKAMAFVG
jgi:hypothetical protein